MEKKTKNCLDCKKPITRRAERCGSCSKKGIKSSGFIDGRTMKSFCIDCKNKLKKGSYLSLRCKSCSLKFQHKSGIRNVKGKNNPNFNNGISKYGHPHYFNKKLKQKIKERDNYICSACGKTQNLCVHHINYDKINCKEDNLITVCISCNSKANFDRDYWFSYYKYIMEEKLCLF